MVKNQNNWEKNPTYLAKRHTKCNRNRQSKSSYIYHSRKHSYGIIGYLWYSRTRALLAATEIGHSINTTKILYTNPKNTPFVGHSIFETYYYLNQGNQVLKFERQRSHRPHNVRSGNIKGYSFWERYHEQSPTYTENCEIHPTKCVNGNKGTQIWDRVFLQNPLHKTSWQPGYSNLNYSQMTRVLKFETCFSHGSVQHKVGNQGTRFCDGLFLLSQLHKAIDK